MKRINKQLKAPTKEHRKNPKDERRRTQNGKTTTNINISHPQP